MKSKNNENEDINNNKNDLKLEKSLLEYNNPLIDRYCSPEMSLIFSPKNKFSTWRKLWLNLAQSQYELKLQGIKKENLEDMKSNIELNSQDFKEAAKKEKEIRHDVMAHIHTFGSKCKLESTKKIIHLGATSCFVGDNTDIILMKQGLDLIESKMIILIDQLSKFCLKWKDFPTLGFTHFQPAQLTTIGKRASLWLQDFYLDFQNLKNIKNNFLLFRGVKGTTGTQASYLKLFENDNEKVRKLDEKVTENMGFDSKKQLLRLTGQTYTRKIDSMILNTLSLIAESSHKMATDIRLLMHLKEVEEPFGKKQVGSSAMAYKRNPMRSERICGLSRFVIELAGNGKHTAANQWFERTLDDSSNKRLSIPQSFLAIDGILKIAINITNGLVVWPEIVKKNVMNELPFMATENILMSAVKKGGNRQLLHEVIREHSMEASKMIKAHGKKNDLLERLKKDENFKKLNMEKEIDKMCDPNLFIGRSAKQVEEFIDEIIQPMLNEKKNQKILQNLEMGEIGKLSV